MQKVRGQGGEGRGSVGVDCELLGGKSERKKSVCGALAPPEINTAHHKT